MQETLFSSKVEPLSGADRSELGWGRLWAAQSRESQGSGGCKTRVCCRGGSALFHPSPVPLCGEKVQSFAFQGTADFSLQ